MQDKSMMSYGLIFVAAMFSFNMFYVVAHPTRIWEDAGGELSFAAATRSVVFLSVTTAFFAAICLLRFLVSGFHLAISILLHILLLLWSILYAVRLVAVMPWRPFDYGGLGVSSAFVIFCYVKIKEEHRRLQSAGKV